jgi:hypothetical protein
VLKSIFLFVAVLGVAQADSVFSDTIFYISGAGTHSSSDVTSVSNNINNLAASGWNITFDLDTDITGPIPTGSFTEPLTFDVDFTATCGRAPGVACGATQFQFGFTFDALFDGGDPFTWALGVAGTGPVGNTSFAYNIGGFDSNNAALSGPTYSFTDGGTFDNGSSELSMTLNGSFALAAGNGSTTIPAGKTIDFSLQSTVPEPAVGFGVGIALAGLAAWRMRRARR